MHNYVAARYRWRTGYILDPTAARDPRKRLPGTPVVVGIHNTIIISGYAMNAA